MNCTYKTFMGVVSVFTLRGVFCKPVLFAEVDILEALDAKFVLVDLSF